MSLGPSSFMMGQLPSSIRQADSLPIGESLSCSPSMKEEGPRDIVVDL